MSARSSEAPARRYAAGLPYVRDRPLSEEDRRWLLRRLDLHKWTAAAFVIGLATIVAGSVMAADTWPRWARLVHGAPGMTLIALGTVGVAGCLGWSRGWWRALALLGAGTLLGAMAADTWVPAVEQPRWLIAELLIGTTVLGLSAVGLAVVRLIRLLRLTPRIRADLCESESESEVEADARLECFEGQASSAPARLLARLDPSSSRRERRRRQRSGAPLRLEVLPRSGVVVYADGRRVERWEAIYVAEVAPAQPHALRVELPQGVAPAAPDPRLCLRRRSLTPDEREELQRHIGRLRRRAWPVAVLTLVVLGLVAWDLRTIEPDRILPVDAISLGWLALLVVVYIGDARRRLAARKLEHDRRLRWVVTVHQEVDDPQCDPPSLEVLPISQLAWTERTSPALWRMSRL